MSATLCSPVALPAHSSAAVRRLGSFCQPFKPLIQPSTNHRAACKSSSASNATLVTEPTTAVASQAGTLAGAWAAFAEAVSGEWEGVTASFGPDGEPVPLPEYYVPQAYRDWGVELFDWQSQCSALADTTGLRATTRRMMPTVGCEADAIAYTQAAAQLFAADSDAATVAPGGSYSHHGPVADISSPDCHKAALEQCLVLAPRQQRLRVVHNLRRRAADGCWVLDSVELHFERWDSPFRGKLELSGCGGGMKGFAGDQRLAAEALQGSWQASGVRYKVDGATGQCVSQQVSGQAWSADGLPDGSLLLHPLRAWSSCQIQGEDVTVAAGVLLDEVGASMAVASRRLVGGQLAEAELLTLTRAA